MFLYHQSNLSGFYWCHQCSWTLEAIQWLGSGCGSVASSSPVINGVLKKLPTYCQLYWRDENNLARLKNAGKPNYSVNKVFCATRSIDSRSFLSYLSEPSNACSTKNKGTYFFILIYGCEEIFSTYLTTYLPTDRARQIRVLKTKHECYVRVNTILLSRCCCFLLFSFARSLMFCYKSFFS